MVTDPMGYVRLFAVERTGVDRRWVGEVTIQDLGSIGEPLAAIATLAYLAVWLKQNTASARAGSAAGLSNIAR